MDAKLPLSLILDDCAPINAAYFMHPEEAHVLSVPTSFTADFASVCESHDVRGKYSVLPMPSAAGRIDRSLSYVSAGDLEAFLDIVRTRLAGRHHPRTTHAPGGVRHRQRSTPAPL